MTEQSRLHHLLGRMRRGALLPEEREQLAGLVGELEKSAANLRVMYDVASNRESDLIDERDGLLTEVARLTAGQCTHALDVG